MVLYAKTSKVPQMSNRTVKIIIGGLAVLGFGQPAMVHASYPAIPEYAPVVKTRGELVVEAALEQLGVPYKYARSVPGVAFDCSGLTAYAWGTQGVILPRSSRAQYKVTQPVSEAIPGDLLFFKKPVGHVAIYIGDGKMIHAPRRGDVVKIVDVNWNKVVGIGRP